MAKQPTRRSNSSDPRIRDLRRSLRAAGNAEHARFHKGYHKSSLSFHGLKTPAMRAAARAAFPRRDKLERKELLELVTELWTFEWFEERFCALELLSRAAPELGARDLPLIKRLTTHCDGWVLLDHLACNTLSPLALNLGEPIYDKVCTWSRHRHMWTRRASILVHIRPARASELALDRAFETFEERLFEEEFFIRKAIGWTLRECSRHYPKQVHEFLVRVGDAASGLTRREGARNLPAALRRAVLGK